MFLNLFLDLRKSQIGSRYQGFKSSSLFLKIETSTNQRSSQSTFEDIVCVIYHCKAQVLRFLNLFSNQKKSQIGPRYQDFKSSSLFLKIEISTNYGCYWSMFGDIVCIVYHWKAEKMVMETYIYLFAHDAWYLRKIGPNF